MIKEVAGDILLSKAECTAHGVAVNDDFKVGLALSIRERWPALYKDFRHYCHTKSPEPGEVFTWGGSEHTVLYNLLTQNPPVGHGDHPHKAELKHVSHALKNLRKILEKESFKSLAMPKIATGVGGLEWKDVYPLIQENLGNLPMTVYLYTTYKKGVAAEEV